MNRYDFEIFDRIPPVLRFYMAKHSGQTFGIIDEYDMLVMLRKKIKNSPDSFCVTLYERNNAGEMVFAGYSVRSNHCDELFRADLV